MEVSFAAGGENAAGMGQDLWRATRTHSPKFIYRRVGAGQDNSISSYLLGSYRSATAPDPNSRRLTSFKSTYFDSPANNVGPWPASLGCTTNSYSSIKPSSASASGSCRPPTNNPLPGSCLSCSTAFPRSPRQLSALQSTRSSVLDTTYFFAESIVRANGFIQSAIQSGITPVAGIRQAASIIS